MIMDLTNYEISSAIPAKGFVVTQYDADGYPIRGTLYGSWTTIPESMFACGWSTGPTGSFSRLQSIDFATTGTVATVSSSAFFGCAALNLTTVPNAVTSSAIQILSNAFSRCNSISTFTLPEGVTNIGAYAFGYCESLQSFTITNKPARFSLSTYAFYGCSGVEFHVPWDSGDVAGVVTTGTDPNAWGAHDSRVYYKNDAYYEDVGTFA